MKAYYKKENLIFEIGYDRKIKSIKIVEKEKIGAKSPLSDLAFKEISKFLDGKLEKFSFEIEPQGTNFQKKVWKEIEKIPYGKTLTYKEIGEKLNSKAYQAIGTACGKNPILFRIPCHRVLGKNNLGGFFYGLDLKKNLLKMEKSCKS
ncbi:methylated-DNA--[protein]-cysteine S-methyltransferase [Anaerococcus hydrogenalis]|uniref:Methylated-DNA--[protein]-cysteine S-methyltransferase n=1 Tax=Anaerococcus hydrogenalis TaxID=33029 RepID=A0A2N6UI69_9FIRM|nr:methylated-DNA--[protein]-cysteine S-methyltransferase [Anaerococcus hydrogenalis]MDK7695311.1 methylated-DNA--[protein]-cysteine S-methyltransferase [Anaerococcus hydrogenalis]MDK7697070.1 methylated-DNA--[protein]-cysteine S-methyltransferase [Anaerococcus hydrogenalis]MDK7708409.1 methylated-DNA--[protein]-cysteine S-methyltransferase [Anaerococcus hydrogenalis]PMC81233.1 methylated-DNA--[protein]-cysteine S-methyltransferase [Anaerococcus hydrogenalis]